jgi:VWFA-related protein
VTPLWLVLAAGLQVQPPTFASSLETVYLDVFVQDREGPVIGLAASDFVLRDNGVPQKVELVAIESLPLTTLLVLDASGSVVGWKLQRLQEASQALVRRTRPADPLALLTFGHEIKVKVPATTDHARIEETLEALLPGGSTAIYDAVYAAALIAPQRARSLIVLFTDGEDNLSVLDVPALVRVLEQSDVLVQVVGIAYPRGGGGSAWYGVAEVAHDAYADSVTAQRVGEAQNTALKHQAAAGGFDVSEHLRTLGRMAEATGGRFWPALMSSAPDALAKAFVAITEAMRTRYVLKFEPQGVAREGRHVLSVALKGRKATVQHRKAYFAAAAR